MAPETDTERNLRANLRAEAAEILGCPHFRQLYNTLGHLLAIHDRLQLLESRQLQNKHVQSRPCVDDTVINPSMLTSASQGAVVSGASNMNTLQGPQDMLPGTLDKVDGRLLPSLMERPSTPTVDQRVKVSNLHHVLNAITNDGNVEIEPLNKKPPMAWWKTSVAGVDCVDLMMDPAMGETDVLGSPEKPGTPAVTPVESESGSPHSTFTPMLDLSPVEIAFM